MNLRRSSGSVDDPFFAALRARRPDVDLVVLPPEPPLPRGERLDLAGLRTRRDADCGFADELWWRATQEPVPLRHTTVPGPDTVRWESRGELRGVPDGRQVLERLAEGLPGWSLRRAGREVLLLGGRAPDGRTLTATYAEDTDALVFHLRSADLPATDEARSALRGERR